jgi:uncharacterized protein RhaS with RHS repeats
MSGTPRIRAVISVSLNGVEQAGYLYNFAGQQVVRTVWQGGAAARTVSAHDVAGSRLGEYDGDTGALLREYLWLGDLPPIFMGGAVLEGGQLHHLHADQIDRPVLATDGFGAVVWAASYTPFGGIHQVSADTGSAACHSSKRLSAYVAPSSTDRIGRAWSRWNPVAPMMTIHGKISAPSQAWMVRNSRRT